MKTIKDELMEIYNTMLVKEGHRKWWPGDTPLEISIGAILTQFVSWGNVETAIEELKNNDLLDLREISKVDTGKLERFILSTRFYKQKARKLKGFANYIINNYSGSLSEFFKLDIKTLRNELLHIWGIGEETADSIILYAANKPVFVVDEYTKRIFNRMDYIDRNESYSSIQNFFHRNLDKDTKLFNDYHAQIVNLGNNYCKKRKPKCDSCPLGELCMINEIA
jgi:endonuclease-3 related protein